MSAELLSELNDLKAGQHDLIGDVIGDSFADDPVNSWIFGGRQSITAYYTLSAKKLYLPQGFGHIMSDNSGGALWLEPGTDKQIPLHKSLDIAKSMIAYNGVKAIIRGLKIDSALATAKPLEPHYYLFAIGTRPQHQGKGIGGRLMRAGLQRADRDSMPTYLECSKEINVPFYKRFGFEVIQKVIPSKDAPPLWVMWREARK